MAEATQVPTQGFAAPPPIPALGVPDSGTPAGNGTPTQYPGQTPGFVKPGQTPAPQTTAPGTPDQPVSLDGIAELLRQALGSQTPAQTAQTPTTPAQPGWVPPQLNTFDVNSIADPGIKSMAQVLQVTGKDLDLNRALGRAMSEGDPSLVDFAYIAEKGGAAAPQLAQIAQSIVQAVAAKSEAITNEVHALVGGAAVWSQATAVFNTSAPQEIKVLVQQMLNSTDEAHIKAGAKIVAEFGRASGKMPQAGAGLLQHIAAGGVNGQGLTKGAFQDELRKLDPQSRDFEQLRESLFTRRSLGKAAGL